MINSKPITRLPLFTCTLLILSFILFAACNNTEETKTTGVTSAPPAFDLTVAKKEIEEADRNFSDALNRGDSTGLANLYTADAKMMGPNEPAIVGRKNIQTAIAGFINAGITKAVFTTIDVWGTEAMLAEEGELALFGKGGKQTDKGKYIVLWKKEDGKWKLFRDFFNSDLPVPAHK